jgi:hypothetical protein
MRAHQTRKGLEETAATYATAAEALGRFNRELAAIASELRDINPRANLRLHQVRRRVKGQLAGSNDAREMLRALRRESKQPTSALRLRLNECGASSCSGCPHPHWGVWRVFRDHETGEIKQFMQEVSGATMWAYARHAPNPKTLELVKRAEDVIKQRSRLIAAFASLGRVARASHAKTTEDVPT